MPSVAENADAPPVQVISFATRRLKTSRTTAHLRTKSASLRYQVICRSTRATPSDRRNWHWYAHSSAARTLWMRSESSVTRLRAEKAGSRFAVDSAKISRVVLFSGHPKCVGDCIVLRAASCWSVVRNLLTPLSGISSLTGVDRFLEFMGVSGPFVVARSLGCRNCGPTRGMFA